MKTLGRIVIILCAFALVMGLTYVAANAVSAGGSSTGSAAPAFGSDRGFPRPDGARREFHGEGGGGWMFGMIRNAGIVAVIVALVVVPKSIGRKRIRRISASVG